MTMAEKKDKEVLNVLSTYKDKINGSVIKNHAIEEL